MKTLARDPRLKTMFALIKEYGPFPVLDEFTTYIAGQSMKVERSGDRILARNLMNLVKAIDRVVERFQ